MLTQDDLIRAFLSSHITAMLFYWGVAKLSGNGGETLRYVGFGMLMGFSAFFIITVLSTRFHLNLLVQFIITVGYCSMFLNSRLLERFMTSER